MPKIGILTFHRVVNYGAALQSYGLWQALQPIGIDAEIIDYRARSIEREYLAFRWHGDTICKKYKNILLSFCYYKMRQKKNAAFQHFLARMPLSEPVTEPACLAGRYSAFVTGSDQVFNRTITKEDADVYLLRFVKDGRKKYSYAASFGTASLQEEDAVWFKEHLQDFKAISLREGSGKTLVQSMLNREAHVCLDPTLLLKKEDWQALCDYRRTRDGYILLYPMLPVDRLYEYADTLSKQTGLNVICLNASLKKRIRYPRFQYIDDASPEEFLGLFHAASYVVTSSFHGTAFSINFQKSFVTILPENDPRNDRALSLLRLTGLENRAMMCPSDNIDIDEPINWEDVEQRLAQEREASVEYLRCIGNS